MKQTKIISVILAIIMVLSTCIIANAAESKEVITGAITNARELTLYAHGVSGNSEETEAWQKMQWNNTQNCYYFYLPSGADNKTVEIYNNTTSTATIGSTSIPSEKAVSVSYDTHTTYNVNFAGQQRKLKFMKSTAEAAVYMNNSNANGNGTGLWEYLSQNKSNSATATGAIIGKDGSVDNTTIKKIKGRGNTTWDKAKKPFNVTYNEKVSIDGMESGKKYSFLANYQDGSLSRNRFLYDLSDAVGMPYASDSRYVDFYVDGEYKGSYQAAQKVDTGNGNLLSDIDEEGYLNEDKVTMAKDFAFVCEIDASAGDEDYTFRSSSGNNVTMKVPELSRGDKYYNDVLDYAQKKFDAMFDAIASNASNLNDIIDVDSLAKLYLINELGKNWDSGVSSTFFAYKQDENGNWKFYASPVWDYDNSLGNATGVQDDLWRMGVDDYTEPSGWWCEYKGIVSQNNIISNAVNNKDVRAAVPKVWFEKFVPALKTFTSTGVSDGELYSKDVYYNYISGSADMNYTSGWELITGSWISNHSMLYVYTYDYDTHTLTTPTKATAYDSSNFEGEFNYTVDWMLSRSAWLSDQFYNGYTPSESVPTTVPKTEPTTVPKTEPTTVPKTEPTTAPKTEPTTTPKTEPTTTPKTEPTTDEPSTTEPPVLDGVIIGDIDSDEDINVKDATLIQLYLANLNVFGPKQLLAADVDNSGEIDVKDATYIQLYCANLLSENFFIGSKK